jgi:ribonuclease BN (tRNA processing enzyme)
MRDIIAGLFLLSAILTSSVKAEEQLTATIIGSGSPIYNENRASASVLVSAGDTHILVDMGNGTQANLNKLGIEVRDLSSLLFTHHHLDHNEEFVPIFIRSLLGRNNFTIIGPPNTVKLTEANLALYEEDISYRLGKTQRTLVDRQKAFDVRDIQGGESFSIGNISVRTIEVPHTIHTIAYRFDYNGQSIVVTGDLTYSETLPSFAKNVDFMIIDSGGMVMTGGRSKDRNTKKSSGGSEKGKNKNSRTRAHLDLADSSSMAKQAKVKNLVYTHFNASVVDTDASLKEIRKNYAGNVIFAEDLMVLKKADNNQSSTTLNSPLPYPIVDTGQKTFYSNDGGISLPTEGEDFFGQDGSYIINEPSYTDNHDGTITDNVTGLMWQKELGDKLSYTEALDSIQGFELAGHADWRIATLKELYSLIQFTGKVKGEKAITPFIDTKYFDQPLGDTGQGEREIDAQVWSSTEYVAKTMKNDETIFGVNFVDGRIKGYPKYNPRTGTPNKMYFRFVRDNNAYGKNSFVDNGDGTITDTATGLMWQQADSNEGLNWQSSLEYAENLNLGGHNDWRLPNAKELQSIVDYTRSPTTSGSAAIDPIFQASSIKNEANEKDYPYYWSSTTHLDGPVPEKNAVYIAFGKALGEMRGSIMDVHGAGSQRSDPKTGEPMSRGPQGDMIRVKNYVRSVRGGAIQAPTTASIEDINQYSVGDKQEPLITNKKQPSSSGNNKFINRLDKNGDGKVSSSEFKAGANRFKHIDKNNDGYITVDEAPTGPPKER